VQVLAVVLRRPAVTLHSRQQQQQQAMMLAPGALRRLVCHQRCAAKRFGIICRTAMMAHSSLQSWAQQRT
jgi:hypothetical protein